MEKVQNFFLLNKIWFQSNFKPKPKLPLNTRNDDSSARKVVQVHLLNRGDGIPLSTIGDCLLNLCVAILWMLDSSSHWARLSQSNHNGNSCLADLYSRRCRWIRRIDWILCCNLLLPIIHTALSNKSSPFKMIASSQDQSNQRGFSSKPQFPKRVPRRKTEEKRSKFIGQSQLNGP